MGSGAGLRARLAGVVCVAAGLACARAACGQDPAVMEKIRATPHGSVVGDVYDEGTKLPVRFALVQLVPKPPAEASPRPAEGPPPAPGTMAPGTMVPAPEARLSMVAGMSAMDGSFHLDGVPAGDYLVAALQLGYVLPFQARLAEPQVTEDQLRALAASMPVVHVGVGQVASVHLTLRRGAAISGRVRFADGSALIGGRVSWEPATEPEFSSERDSPVKEALTSLSLLREQHPREATTDDEGRFRVFGLPPGRYILSSGIALDHSPGHVAYSNGGGSQTGGREHMFPEMIEVYQPGVFRRKDAKVFEIKGDEQITGADLTIDPEGLHTVRGRVLAAEDRHVPSAGMVRLKEAGGKDAGRMIELEEDGSFELHYVPSGSYRMEVVASDQSSASDGGLVQVKRYKTVVLPAIVGEHDTVLDEVLMAPLKPGERDEEPPF